MIPEEPINVGPSAESYARLAQAQEWSSRNPSAQDSVAQMLERLRIERDATVSAGLPTRYNQQTIVGNVSGAGNRHVIEDTPVTRRPTNVPNPIFDDVSESCIPPSADQSKIYVRATHYVNGHWKCYWLVTTECP